MAEEIETLLREVDLQEGRKFQRKTTELERFESLIEEDEVIETIGDLDAIEEIARDIDTRMEGLLGSVENYARLKNSKTRVVSLNMGPRKKRIVRKKMPVTN